jgi:hypothetical protein
VSVFGTRGSLILKGRRRRKRRRRRRRKKKGGGEKEQEKRRKKAGKDIYCSMLIEILNPASKLNLKS